MIHPWERSISVPPADGIWPFDHPERKSHRWISNLELRPPSDLTTHQFPFSLRWPHFNSFQPKTKTQGYFCRPHSISGIQHSQLTKMTWALGCAAEKASSKLIESHWTLILPLLSSTNTTSTTWLMFRLQSFQKKVKGERPNYSIWPLYLYLYLCVVFVFVFGWKVIRPN